MWTKPAPDQLEGHREVTETEPGVFRRTEIIGDAVHLAKMAYRETRYSPVRPAQPIP